MVAIFFHLNFQSPGAVCTPPIKDAMITCNNVQAMVLDSKATCNASHPDVTHIDAAGYSVTQEYPLGAIIVVNTLKGSEPE